MRIIYGSSPITLTEALFVTVISMTVVFLVLILISFILSLFKYIPSEKEGNKRQSQPTVFKPSQENRAKLSPEDIKDDKMLAAVMVSVIEAAGEDENAYVRVKSIREVN
ncbi:sodium pump decarboxylase, gamma subunit subfamily [Leptotrichia sp. OH3620_COT-345]|uniref:OadG family protein n=1 Tax=Leptotrichia sp. OH3620_COT-345 TaxID=2491048 RepID=UPI000F64B14A|nr:OadG family protein [Leptotrichia sp. OH3620_COT-345]RRD40689.1 sodium pump decarboxylase, gamma subunit subfamily [Leptotrichia sp. OH3620_COT-345]